MKKDIKGKYFQSEKQLMDVINFLPDATLAIDKEGKVIIWNNAMEDLTGVKSEDILGKGDYEYSIPFYKTRRPILADLVLASDYKIEKNYPTFKKNRDALYGEAFVPGIRDGGAYIWGIAKPLYDSAGAVIGAIETFRDITEQKLAMGIIARQKDELSDAVTKLQQKNREYEEANRKLSDARGELEKINERLRFSEEKFSKAFKNSPMVVSLSTIAEGRYVDVSDSFYEVTGFSKEEVIDHTAFELNIWADPGDRDRIIRELNESGRVRDLEISFRLKGGAIRTKLFSADIVTIADTAYLLAINFDITERKLAEDTIRRQKIALEAVNNELKKTIRQMEETHFDLMKTQQELLASNERLRFSEEKFSKTVHLGPVIITLTRLTDGVYVEVSDYFLKLTGYTREEVIGRSSRDLNIWADPADRDRVISLLKNEGVVREIELNFCSRTGGIYVMRYSAEIITIAGVQHLASVAVDITERKRAEEEKEQLEKQLLQSQKMESVGRLAGGIAHDFNNLLTAIIGNVELAMMKLNPGEAASANLELVKKAAESAASLTKQLLAFSRKQIIEPKVIDLNDMIVQMQKMLGRLIGEDIKIHTAANSVHGRIKADPGNIEQILLNLAVNARDAMPQGGSLTLETGDIYLDEHYCKSHAYALPGEYVMLSVSDNGTGMSEEVKSHLFEPFFTTKPKGKGTGLGLAMVYGAVKQNRGTVEIYSVPDKGTSFKIYFPVFTGEADPHEKPAADTLYEGGETVLLVEDDPMVLDFAANVLERMGYNVLQASNGENAFEIEKSYDKRIDLLITDVVLPGVNGKMLSEELKDKRPDLRVLFTSGYTENSIAHHGVLDDGINFIGKPYSAYALSKKIRDTLEKR